MFARIVALLMFISITVVSPFARAGSRVNEPSLDLTMDVGQAGALVCTVLPPGQEDQGCDGLDVSAIRMSIPAKGAIAPLHFALVRFDDWGFGVTLSSAKVSPFTEEQINEFVSGMEAKTATPPRGSRAGRRFDFIELDNVHGFRTQWTLHAPEDAPNQALSYVLVEKHASAIVTFIFFEKDAAKMTPIAESIVHTVETPTYKHEHFGQSKYYLIGYYGGGFVFTAIGFIVAAVLILRSRRREALTRNAAGSVS